MEHGGKRDGAGRKPLKVPREKLVVYVTSDEQAAIKDLLNGLRSQSSLEEVGSNTLALALELSYEIEIADLKIIHQDEISTLKSIFRNKVKDIHLEMNKLKERYEGEIDTLTEYYEADLEILRRGGAD
jgi:hypothetical protein